VPHRSAADERLGHAVDADRALHPRRLTQLFHRLLERDGVEDGGEHAHVVGGRAGDVPLGAEGRAADEIASPDDHRELHAHPADLDALAGDFVQLIPFDAKAPFGAEPLPADLEEHALVNRLGGGGGHRAGIIRMGVRGERRAFEPKITTKSPSARSDSWAVKLNAAWTPRWNFLKNDRLGKASWKPVVPSEITSCAS
jgi:hypothetical protein